MTNTSLTDVQRVMLEAVAVPRLLDCLPNPVVIIQGEAAWLNAPANELNDWLRRGDTSRSLETELRVALQANVPPSPSGSSTRIALSLKKASGDERAYRAVVLDASLGESGAGSVAFLLMEIEGAGLEDHLFATQANSEIARARLEEVQRQLLQADRLSTIGQLAAGVAHEINNPIGYVQSNLVTLADYVSSMFLLIAAQDSVLRQLRTEQTELLAQPEQVRQQIDFDFLSKDLPILLAESQEGITRVRKIIQDLREFSRAGHLESWSLADLHSGIDSTINIVWNDLKYKVELIKHYGDIPAIECLPSQLNQVFMNILVNAGHAIEKRGQITIVTRADADFVYVEIADTGKGIAPEHLARVFEPFFTTKAVGQGTGLGLSISYGIVRKHGGDIDVRSEVGAGTMFIVKLPVRQQHPESDAAA